MGRYKEGEEDREKAKLVAAFWGTKFVQFHAALKIFNVRPYEGIYFHVFLTFIWCFCKRLSIYFVKNVDNWRTTCMYSQIGLIVSKLKKQTTPNCWTMRLLACNLHFLLFFLFFLSFLPHSCECNPFEKCCKVVQIFYSYNLITAFVQFARLIEDNF